MDHDFKTIAEKWVTENLGDDKSEVVAVSKAELDRLNWTATMATDILGKVVDRYDEVVKKSVMVPARLTGSTAVSIDSRDLDPLNKMIVAAESFLEELDS